LAEPLRPARGGFLRPFGCGLFIKEFLLGYGPNGSPSINPRLGACQSDIFYHYKTALMRATAVDQATRIEEKRARREKRSIEPANIERLAEQYLSRMPYKSRGCDSIVLSCIFPTFNDCIGWNLPGEKSRQVFRIIIHPARHADIFRLTDAGRTAPESAWDNPYRALYG